MPGPEWDETFKMVEKCQDRRLGFESHDQLWPSPLMKMLSKAFLQSGHKFLTPDPGLHEVQGILRRLWKKTQKVREAHNAHIDGSGGERKSPQRSQPVFRRHHLRYLKREIDLCGRAVMLACANEDEVFFDELARRAKATFGFRRKGEDVTQQEMIIVTAGDLWFETFTNPSREAVFAALEKRGIRVRPKDQAQVLKRYKLQFLISEVGPGRPRKKISAKTHKALTEHDNSSEVIFLRKRGHRKLG